MTHEHEHEHEHGQHDDRDHGGAGRRENDQEAHGDHGHPHQHAHLSPEEYAHALRAAKDAYMREDESSPLPLEDRTVFSGLRYYPYDPTLALTVPLDREVSSEPVQMGTSTGDSREYLRVGKIRFEVHATVTEVTIYGTANSLFLPIRDATSGNETYGAGRYVEPDMAGDDTVFVDFNLLYNPYCAYNEHFSCPLPPVENWLKVPIEAGEKMYRLHARDGD